MTSSRNTDVAAAPVLNIVQEPNHIILQLTCFTARLCQVVECMMAGGLLSGLSVMASDKARLLVQAAHTATNVASLAKIQPELASLEELVRMAASTSASAILLHCKELAAALEKLGLLKNSTLDMSASDGATPVQWGLHVQVWKSNMHL